MVQSPTGPAGGWTVSRHPAGKRFAFTIVHDADSAYSRRLAPLFEVFDALGLRLTVSAFALWADWAGEGAIWSRWRRPADAAERLRAPRSVPLRDAEECAFYQSLAGRGHEIALHTPRETSSRREDLLRAFELFARAFGRAPAVYTEHSRRSKRDALANEGADPASPYYCLDLLVGAGPWVWVDGPGAMYGDDARGAPTFAIPPEASPIDHRARQHYGLDRAFVRTGGWKNADGDGFLRAYSTANLDALERGDGLALVYSHLDAGWLDPATGQMRADLRRRLEELAARPGWFAPAGEILDRVAAADAVTIRRDGRALAITNPGATRIERLLLRKQSTGEERILPSLAAGETVHVDV